MPLHVLTHVDADHVLIRIEQGLRQRLGKFSLAYTGRPQEDERTNRPARVLNTGTGANHCIGDQMDGLILSHNALMQNFIEAQELVTFTLYQACHRNTRPA